MCTWYGRCNAIYFPGWYRSKQFKETKQLHKQVTKEEMLAVAEAWRPYRTIAAMMLWRRTYIIQKGYQTQG